MREAPLSRRDKKRARVRAALTLRRSLGAEVKALRSRVEQLMWVHSQKEQLAAELQTTRETLRLTEFIAAIDRRNHLAQRDRANEALQCVARLRRERDKHLCHSETAWAEVMEENRTLRARVAELEAETADAPYEGGTHDRPDVERLEEAYNLAMAQTEADQARIAKLDGQLEEARRERQALRARFVELQAENDELFRTWRRRRTAITAVREVLTKAHEYSAAYDLAGDLEDALRDAPP